MISSSAKKLSISTYILLRTLANAKLLELFFSGRSPVSQSPNIEVEDFLTVLQVLKTLSSSFSSNSVTPDLKGILDQLLDQYSKFFTAQKSVEGNRARVKKQFAKTASASNTEPIFETDEVSKRLTSIQQSSALASDRLKDLTDLAWNWKQRRNPDPHSIDAPILTCCERDINALTLFVGDLAAQIFPQPILQFLKTIVEKGSSELKPLNDIKDLSEIFQQTLGILVRIFTEHAVRFVFRKRLLESAEVRIIPSPSPIAANVALTSSLLVSPSPSPAPSNSVSQPVTNPVSTTGSGSFSSTAITGAQLPLPQAAVASQSMSTVTTILQIVNEDEDKEWCQKNEQLEIMAKMFRAHANMLNSGKYYKTQQSKIEQPTPSQSSSSSLLATAASVEPVSSSVNRTSKELKKFEEIATNIAIMLDLTALRVREFDNEKNIFAEKLLPLWNYSCQTRLLLLSNEGPQASPQPVMQALLGFTEKMYESAFLPQETQANRSTFGQILVVKYMEFISAQTKEIINHGSPLPSLSKITLLRQFTDALLCIYKKKAPSTSSSPASLSDDKAVDIQSNISTLNLVREFWLSPHLHSFLDYCALPLTMHLKEETLELIDSSLNFIPRMQDITLNCLAYGHVEGARVALEAVLQSNYMLQLQAKFDSCLPAGFMFENDVFIKGRKFIFPFFASMRNKLPPKEYPREFGKGNAGYTNEFLSIFLRSITSVMSQVVENIDDTSTAFEQDFRIASASIANCINLFDTEKLRIDLLASCCQNVQKCITSSQVSKWGNRHFDAIDHLMGMLMAKSFYKYLPREKKDDKEWNKIVALNPNHFPADYCAIPRLSLDSSGASESEFSSPVLSSLSNGLTRHKLLTEVIHNRLIEVIEGLMKQGSDSDKMPKIVKLGAFWSLEEGQGFIKAFYKYCATVQEKPDNIFHISAKFMAEFIVKICDFSLNCLALGEIDSSFSAVKLILEHPCMLILHNDMYSKVLPDVMPRDGLSRGQFREFFDRMRDNFGLLPLQNAIKRLDANSKDCIILRKNTVDIDYIARFLHEVSRMLYLMVDEQRRNQDRWGLGEIKQLREIVRSFFQNDLRINISKFLDFRAIVQSYFKNNTAVDQSGSPLAFPVGMLYGNMHQERFPYSIASLEGVADYDNTYVPRNELLSIEDVLRTQEVPANSLAPAGSSSPSSIIPLALQSAPKPSSAAVVSPPLDSVPPAAPKPSSAAVVSPPLDNGVPPAPPLDDGVPPAPPLGDGVPPAPPLDDDSPKPQPVNANASKNTPHVGGLLAEIQNFGQNHRLKSVSAVPREAAPHAKADHKRPPPTGASGSGIPQGLSDALTRRKNLIESAPPSSITSIADGGVEIKTDTTGAYRKLRPHMQVFDESSVDSADKISQQAEHHTFKFICGKNNQLFITYYDSKGDPVKRKAPDMLIRKLRELFCSTLTDSKTIIYADLFDVINDPRNNFKKNSLEDFLCDKKVNSIAASISARRPAISGTQDEDNDDNDEHYGAPVSAPESVVVPSNNTSVSPQSSDENATIVWEGISVLKSPSPVPSSSSPLLSHMSLLVQRSKTPTAPPSTPVPESSASTPSPNG